VIWNPEYECMDRTALHDLQVRRLQMTVSWAYRGSRTTRPARRHGSEAARHRSLADLKSFRSQTRACETPILSGCSHCPR
jgi:phenylacetate-coenzyme A ligase PaaK-like adenylate-forming protein